MQLRPHMIVSLVSGICLSFNIASSQTGNSSKGENSIKAPSHASPQDKPGISEFFQPKLLGSDFKEADVVAYVDVKEAKVIERSDEGTDCIQHTGNGYCVYQLTATIKEVFKGNIKTNIVVFDTVSEAGAIHKDSLLGERVVFLKYPNSGNHDSLQTIENSTRTIEHDILKNMRKIVRKKG